MKVILLAGGLGTRISEETIDKPKPMVLLNDKPIIWHLMQIFAIQGISDFIIAGGYKVSIIEDWVSTLKSDWNIQVLDTGLDTQTGGRIKLCLEKYPNEKCLATYGDGLGNINIKKLLKFHESQGALATLTAVRPPARFGYLEFDEGKVTRFGEKNQSFAGWVNGGFFVLENEVKDYILEEAEPFETGALPRLTFERQLACFQHAGFWQPMDTLREKNDLAILAKIDRPPWLDFSIER